MKVFTILGICDKKYKYNYDSEFDIIITLFTIIPNYTRTN